MEHEYKNGYINRRSFSLRFFAMVIFKRKRIILSVFFSIVLLVVLVSFLKSPVYQSSAKILVERKLDSDKALLFRMNFSSPFENYDWIQSEIEIITSYTIAARIVKDLELDKNEQESTTQSKSKSEEQFRLAIERFRKKMKIEHLRKSNVVEVIFEAKDRHLAAEVVDKILATYLSYRSEIYDESDTFKFLEEQMRITGRKLSELEQRQANYKHQKDLLFPHTQVEILLTKLSDYEKSLTSVRTKRIGKEAKLSIIYEQMENGSEINFPSTDVSDSPSHEKFITKIKGELVDKELKRDLLRQRFKPTYEEIVELENDIASTKEKIKEEISHITEQEEAAIKTLQAEELSLQESINKIKQEVRQYAQKEYELTQLSRGIEDNREVYSMLLKQREEARISLARFEKGVNVKVISPAVVPVKPIKPRKRLNTILAVILGLFSGLGLAFLLEHNDHSLNSVNELERMTGLTALGYVREIEAGGKF